MKPDPGETALAGMVREVRGPGVRNLLVQIWASVVVLSYGVWTIIRSDGSISWMILGTLCVVLSPVFIASYYAHHASRYGSATVSPTRWRRLIRKAFLYVWVLPYVVLLGALVHRWFAR